MKIDGVMGADIDVENEKSESLPWTKISVIGITLILSFSWAWVYLC